MLDLLLRTSLDLGDALKHIDLNDLWLWRALRRQTYQWDAMALLWLGFLTTTFRAWQMSKTTAPDGQLLGWWGRDQGLRDWQNWWRTPAYVVVIAFVVAFLGSCRLLTDACPRWEQRSSIDAIIECYGSAR